MSDEIIAVLLNQPMPASVLADQMMDGPGMVNKILQTGAGMLAVFIVKKVAELYKKNCWDMITIMVTLISAAITIYFGEWIKAVLPINLLLLLLLVQVAYVGIRWYVKDWREARGYY